MSALARAAGLLAGWRGYAAAAVVAGIAAGYGVAVVLNALHGQEIAALERDQAQDDLVVARRAIQQTTDDLQSMAASARAAAAAGPALTASIDAFSKAVRNANPLPAGCRPDADRVRNLTDSVRAANGAAAR